MCSYHDFLPDDLQHARQSHSLPPVDLYLIFEKLSLTNWIFCLQKSISKLIFVGYTGSKNLVRNRLKIQFFDLDFSKLIFQKSSTDQQEVSLVQNIAENVGSFRNTLWSKGNHNS